MKIASVLGPKKAVGAVVVLALSGLLVSAQAPKHILVVTATQGFRHSSIPLAEKVLAELGEKSHTFDVEYVRGGKDGKDDADIKEKMTADSLKKFDAVIFANTTGDLPIPDKDAFISWVK